LNSRERVLMALKFEETDRVPCDLGAMRSTGISCFAYPKLVKALGLPPRRPKVHDTGQMLALPDKDVLDALGCDVVTIDGGVTNAFEEPEKWHEYDFGGRLPAMVQNPSAFQTLPDGTISQWGHSVMPPSSFVFNEDHSGQPILDLDQPLPLLDLKKYKQDLDAHPITDRQVRELKDLTRRVKDSTDRAVFLADYCSAGIGIAGYCGIGIFPIICKLEPDFVTEFHDITVNHTIETIRTVLPEVKEDVDIILATADDWGTQSSLISSPSTYRQLFLPFYRRFNDEVHRIAPHINIFMHNCGGIYPLLDLVVESGFDIINPIQWSAGGKSFRDWKDRLRGRITMWGGGVNAQHTLPLGSMEDVKNEVEEVVRYCKQGGGYVFCNIHNLLAEVAPEKILAMYRTALSV
jgi:uroporphyrinogen decarboxylase